MDALSIIINIMLVMIIGVLVLYANFNKVLHWGIGLVTAGLIIGGNELRSPIYRFFMAKFEGWLFEGIFILCYIIIWFGLIFLTIWFLKKFQFRSYKNGWRYLFHPRKEDIPLNFRPSLEKVFSPKDWLPRKRWPFSFLSR